MRKSSPGACSGDPVCRRRGVFFCRPSAILGFPLNSIELFGGPLPGDTQFFFSMGPMHFSPSFPALLTYLETGYMERMPGTAG
jgi:hypothetical protein